MALLVLRICSCKAWLVLDFRPNLMARWPLVPTPEVQPLTLTAFQDSDSQEYTEITDLNVLNDTL